VEARINNLVRHRDSAAIDKFIEETAAFSITPKTRDHLIGAKSHDWLQASSKYLRSQ